MEKTTGPKENLLLLKKLSTRGKALWKKSMGLKSQVGNSFSLSEDEEQADRTQKEKKNFRDEVTCGKNHTPAWGSSARAQRKTALVTNFKKTLKIDQIEINKRTFSDTSTGNLPRDKKKKPKRPP